MKNIKSFNEHINESNKETTVSMVAKEWSEKMDDSFFTDFIESFPTKKDFNEKLIDDYLDIDWDDDNRDLSEEEILDEYWNPESEIYMLEELFSNFPGQDIWVDFHTSLTKADW